MTMTFKVPMTHTTYTYNTSRLQSARTSLYTYSSKTRKKKVGDSKKSTSETKNINLDFY